MIIYDNNDKKNNNLSFSYRVPKQWNYLLSDIHHIQSSDAFKTVLKTYLLLQTTDFKFCALSNNKMPDWLQK